MQLGEGSNGATVTVPRGDTIQITLAENPSTGYTWELQPPDSKSVVYKTMVFVPGAGTLAGLKGAPGERTWTFLAADKGTTVIQFMKTDPGGSPVKAFWVNIVIG